MDLNGQVFNNFDVRHPTGPSQGICPKKMHFLGYFFHRLDVLILLCENTKPSPKRAGWAQSVGRYKFDPPPTLQS